jgi:23S rRNA pseudouridine2605 synthase
MRLQKYIARAGIASRRHAEEMILDGRVSVNGTIVTTLGTKVGPGDRVVIDGQSVQLQEVYHYYLLNKPTGIITSSHDPRGRKTVLDLMPDLPVRIYPVGRLDWDTSGMLLLTNDGELTHRLMHPGFGVEKTYRVWLKEPLASAQAALLEQGILLEDGLTAPAAVYRAQPPQERGLEVWEITIHEGRNRQVRRMFAAVGSPVVKLERIKFGPLSDPALKPGQFRPLSRREIKSLYRQAGLPYNS